MGVDKPQASTRRTPKHGLPLTTTHLSSLLASFDLDEGMFFGGDPFEHFAGMGGGGMGGGMRGGGGMGGGGGGGGAAAPRQTTRAATGFGGTRRR